MWAHSAGVPLSRGDPGTQHAWRDGSVALLTLSLAQKRNLCFLQHWGQHFVCSGGTHGHRSSNWQIQISIYLGSGYKSHRAQSKVSLTVLRAVPPPGDQAAVAGGDSVGARWQAHGLHQRAEGGRPGLLQLQQCDVIVERVRVVILVHHNPLDFCHVFGTALRQHAKVGAPVTWIWQPGRGRGQRSTALKVAQILPYLTELDNRGVVQ